MGIMELNVTIRPEDAQKASFVEMLSNCLLATTLKRSLLTSDVSVGVQTAIIEGQKYRVSTEGQNLIRAWMLRLPDLVNRLPATVTLTRIEH